MPPDSKSYGAIVVNAMFAYALLFGAPSALLACAWFRKRLAQRRRQAVTRNLSIHRGLHQHVRVLAAPGQDVTR